MIRSGAFILAVVFLLCGGRGRAQGAGENPDYRPKAGEFPPPGAGHYFCGELVEIDHVNRRGALRLKGDTEENRYHAAPSHRFALLPYGTVSYHGAPAELRDIPIGTVLHGYFLLPPEGDTTIPAPEKATEKYVPKYSHALSLEDDFSFYQRRGRAWKIASIDSQAGTLTVQATGPETVDGLAAEQTFDVDASTRVWKGRQIASVSDLAAGEEIQVNLSWCPEWRYGRFQCIDVWIDGESRTVATEVQRQIHLRYLRHRWLPGWIDRVEHQAGGKGIVTLTLFGGMDSSLYEAARAQAKPGGGAAIAAAEWTLRSWWQDHDNKSGPILDFTDLPNPPPGSSGLQLRVEIRELLEGFHPGRIVRFRPNGFPNVKLPPEERVKTMDDR